MLEVKLRTLVILAAIGCAAEDEATDGAAKPDAGARADGSSGTGGVGGGAAGTVGNLGAAGAAAQSGAAGAAGKSGAAGAAGAGATRGSGGTRGSGASAGTGAAGGGKSYSTEFDGIENPLSEGGVWSHVGLDWRNVEKSGGIAYGTQTGTGGYDDSYAVLSGFPPDH